MHSRLTAKRKASTELESARCHKKQATAESGVHDADTPVATDNSSEIASSDVSFPGADVTSAGRD